MDALGRFLSLLIAIVLILIFPLEYYAQTQTDTMDHLMEHYTSEFTDTIRHDGCITLEGYNEYIEKLNGTGELYQVEIEHASPKSARDIIAEHTLPGVLLASRLTKGLPLSTDNTSEIAGSISSTITSLATHTHTDACYNGTKHTHKGSSTSSGECYTFNYSDSTSETCGTYTGRHSESWSYSYSCSCGLGNVSGTMGVEPSSTWGTCSFCGGTISLDSSSLISEYWECTGNCNMVSSSYGSTHTITRTTDYYTLTCGKTEGAYYNSSGNRVSPTCNNVVVSIVATKQTQTIAVGESMVTTATATYLDGHTATVHCTASGFDNTKIGTQTVTLTYSGLVGNAKITGTRTCTTIVTVQVGLEYITVVPSATTVYNGTEPSYTVKAYYGNGTSKTLTNRQYTKTGWTSGHGTKTVTFSYTESGKTVTASVTITVKPNVTRLDVTPSSSTVYNGVEPAYTVRVVYEDGTSKTLSGSQYTKSGWSSGPGTKTLTFSYTENRRTITASSTITVKPNVTSITVTPATQSIERYQNSSFTVRVNYEDGTSKTTTSFYLTGFNNRNLGTQTVTFSYTENSITKTTTAKVTVTHMTIVCPICGTRYELDDNDVDNGCPVCKITIVSITVTPKEVTLYRGDALPITVTATFRNGGVAVIPSGWTSNYNPYLVGVQQVKVTYQGMHDYITVIVTANEKECPICHRNYPLNPDGTDPGCPYCREELDLIEVQPKNVTMEMHQPIPITVTAFYRDGHSKEVSDWTSNLIPDRAGEFEVTIRYQTKYETIHVTVLDNDLSVCPYCGLTYSRSEYPEGCPVCSKVIVAIEARLRNGGTQILRGSELALEVVLIYRDEHRILTYEGYTISNYYPWQLGMQTVTVNYKDISTTFIIEVIDMLGTRICPNGHRYYLNPDGSDPGCPYCMGTAAEDEIIYYDITYTYEILDILYEMGKYEMEQGDYITVIVSTRETSLRSNILKVFSGRRKADDKTVFGGEVIGSSI